MKHASTLCSLGVALSAWGGVANASSGAIEVALEQRLRAERPDVLRWQLRAMSETAPVSDAAIAGLGRIGARTAVRFADGRVRWYAVIALKPVLVSARGVERGAGFDAEDAELAERDVLSLGCEPVDSLDASRRWRAARRLATGDALCVRDIEAVPDVERDQAVTLNARRGAVNASRVLTAASDAQLGERVRLRDRASGAVVVAIVTGPGAARLSEEQE